MIVDLSDLEPASVLESHVCIIGGGAAGITLALELAERGLDVCVLESGGLVYEQEVQDLARGETAGVPYFPLEISRMRFLGGSTNHWGGWCAPFSEIDFEQREWVAHSGWPFNRASLLGYYRRAQELCELGPFRYQAEDWADEDRSFPDFEASKLEAPCWQFSPPTRFGEVYRDLLISSPRIRVVLHAHVTGLPASAEGNAVEGVEFASLDGARGRATARTYVVACGGLENARLLLLTGWPDGSALGNKHDLVGRYFMEHPHTIAGTVLTADPRRFARTYTVFDRQGTHVVAGLAPSAAAQRRERILNCAASLVFKNNDGTELGYEAYRELVRDVRAGEWPDKTGQRLLTMMSDLGDVADGVGRREGEPYVGAIDWVGFYLRSEQTPNPDSRVVLSDELDPFDQPLSRLEWRLVPADKRAQRVCLQLIGEELGRLGLGRIQFAEWLLADDDSWPDDLSGGYHHMGTTRMAARPEEGVVNSDCRVHGVDNLYVAGSSVFPTGGFANPTLTLVALAVRLAEHLQQRILA
jgi:choline dehydrogenase-like flavoprotein